MSKYFKFIGLNVLILTVFLVQADPKCPNVPIAIGQCINVGAYQLFMQRQGDNGPIVVFDSGRGNTHDTWSKIIPEVSKFARTVSYDRVNLGYSQSMSNVNDPVTAKLVAKDLHTLLHTAKLLPPYILVGHSAGGLYAQMFARLYPKEVSGVVFVDSASPEQIFGNGLPLPAKDSNFYSEALGFIPSLQQVKSAPPFPKIPIVVLNATHHDAQLPVTDPTTKRTVTLDSGKTVLMSQLEIEALMAGWQNKLAKLSPYSTHMYAYGSDHFIQNTQPNLVIDAVYTLIQQQKKATH